MPATVIPFGRPRNGPERPFRPAQADNGDTAESCPCNKEDRLFRRVKPLDLACLLLLAVFAPMRRAAGTRTIGFLVFTATLLGAATPGWTTGGAHFVEDSEVLEPGLCQVDFWVTRFDPGAGYANATPTCTLKSLPRLEWGAQFQHFWFNETATTDQIFGPTAKLNLIPEDTGVGLGFYFNSGVNLRTGALELVTLTVPLTVPLDDRVRFNFNAGWSYLRASPYPDAFFWGGQVEAKIGSEVTLMLETFGRTPGIIGTQMGLRWRPNDGPIDFDLLVGNFFDELSTRFFTVGVTIRW